MNAVQINNALCPLVYLKPTTNVQRQRPLPPSSLSFALHPPRIPISLKFTSNRPKRLSLMPVCLSRGDVQFGNEDKEPFWKSFGKMFESFGKKSSIEDVLKQQIEKREYYEGGSGGKPPGRGSGGGGGGFGGFEDEEVNGVLDETVQIILATLGFIFVYIYIISGEEIVRLGKDYLRYLFKGKKSNRLERVFEQWERFVKRMKSMREKPEVDRFWLEKAIITTPTWWDHPDKYKRFLRSNVETQSGSDDE